MMTDTPRVLMLFLAATTLLGLIMGYCIALIRAKRAARNAIETVRAELSREHKAAQTDLRSTRASIDNLRSSLTDANSRASAARKREEALELHSQLQARRIQKLESQVASYEDQQIRMQRDFASYKSNKSRELELARNKPGAWANAEQIPMLSKRFGGKETESGGADNTDQDLANDIAAQSRQAYSSKATRKRGGLSIPLSRELDIPSLSESELPDSVDELKFEMGDLDSTGGWPRG